MRRVINIFPLATTIIAFPGLGGVPSAASSGVAQEALNLTKH
jgi:hypothetical protein